METPLVKAPQSPNLKSAIILSKQGEAAGIKVQTTIMNRPRTSQLVSKRDSNPHLDTSLKKTHTPTKVPPKPTLQTNQQKRIRQLKMKYKIPAASASQERFRPVISPSKNTKLLSDLLGSGKNDDEQIYGAPNKPRPNNFTKKKSSLQPPSSANAGMKPGRKPLLFSSVKSSAVAPSVNSSAVNSVAVQNPEVKVEIKKVPTLSPKPDKALSSRRTTLHNFYSPNGRSILSQTARNSPPSSGFNRKKSEALKFLSNFNSSQRQSRPREDPQPDGASRPFKSLLKQPSPRYQGTQFNKPEAREPSSEGHSAGPTNSVREFAKVLKQTKIDPPQISIFDQPQLPFSEQQTPTLPILDNASPSFLEAPKVDETFSHSPSKCSSPKSRSSIRSSMKRQKQPIRRVSLTLSVKSRSNKAPSVQSQQDKGSEIAESAHDTPSRTIYNPEAQFDKRQQQTGIFSIKSSEDLNPEMASNPLQQLKQDIPMAPSDQQTTQGKPFVLANEQSSSNPVAQSGAKKTSLVVLDHDLKGTPAAVDMYHAKSYLAEQPNSRQAIIDSSSQPSKSLEMPSSIAQPPSESATTALKRRSKKDRKCQKIQTIMQTSKGSRAQTSKFSQTMKPVQVGEDSVDSPTRSNLTSLAKQPTEFIVIKEDHQGKVKSIEVLISKDSLEIQNKYDETLELSIPAVPSNSQNDIEERVNHTPRRPSRPRAPSDEGSPVILPYVKKSSAKDRRAKNREMKEELVALALEHFQEQIEEDEDALEDDYPVFYLGKCPKNSYEAQKVEEMLEAYNLQKEQERYEEKESLRRRLTVQFQQNQSRNQVPPLLSSKSIIIEEDSNDFSSSMNISAKLKDN